MEQNKVQATTGITFRILVALSICHCLNDTLQSVISAVYPLFKEDLGLSFAQIGLITLVYQSAASVCQPLTGLFFDKWPSAWSLPTGMSFTLVGLLSLAFACTAFVFASLMRIYPPSLLLLLQMSCSLLRRSKGMILRPAVPSRMGAAHHS